MHSMPSSYRFQTSSCWLGDKAVMSVALLLSTMSAYVMRRWYVDSTVLLWSSWPMNWNSSSLFWLSLMNFCLGDRYLGRDSCSTTWSLSPLGMSLWLETRLLVCVPYCVHSWCVVRHLTLHVWQQLHLRVLPKYSGALGFDDVYDCGHIKNNHCSFFCCFTAARSRYACGKKQYYPTWFLDAAYLDLIKTVVLADSYA